MPEMSDANMAELSALIIANVKASFAANPPSKPVLTFDIFSNLPTLQLAELFRRPNFPITIDEELVFATLPYCTVPFHFKQYRRNNILNSIDTYDQRIQYLNMQGNSFISLDKILLGDYEFIPKSVISSTLFTDESGEPDKVGFVTANADLIPYLKAMDLDFALAISREFGERRLGYSHLQRNAYIRSSPTNDGKLPHLVLNHWTINR